MPLKSLLQAFSSKPKKTDASRLRIAVIGGGRMGQYHLKALAKNPQVELVALMDIAGERATPLAKKHRIKPVSRVQDLFNTIDAAVIATPTPTHYDIGKILLGAGISCL